MSGEEVGGEKAVGRTAGWIRTQTERPFATPWMSLRVDTGVLADGDRFTYTYVEAAPAVFVVPVTETGDIVLIRQYRYTIDAWCLEVPAGGTWDRRGQDLIAVAHDELREEIGGVANDSTLPFWFPALGSQAWGWKPNSAASWSNPGVQRG